MASAVVPLRSARAEAGCATGQGRSGLSGNSAPALRLGDFSGTVLLQLHVVFPAHLAAFLSRYGATLLDEPDGRIRIASVLGDCSCLCLWRVGFRPADPWRHDSDARPAGLRDLGSIAMYINAAGHLDY